MCPWDLLGSWGLRAPYPWVSSVQERMHMSPVWSTSLG